MSNQTGEHAHLSAAELFSCKGLTAVVTGACRAAWLRSDPA